MTEKKVLKLGVLHLRRMHACGEHRENFRTLFPNGMTLTEENLFKALDAGLDMWWFIYHTLGDRAVRRWQQCKDRARNRYYDNKLSWDDMNKYKAKWLYKFFNENLDELEKALSQLDPVNR